MSAILGTAVTGSAGAYSISNSLRFRKSASAYLNRTPGSTGNRQKWTVSMWVKRGSLGDGTSGSRTSLFGAGNSAAYPANSFNVRFTADNQIDINSGGAVNMYQISTPVYRDPSSWYHIVFSVDTTQATAANRFRVYVNNQEITAWGTNTQPAQNYNFDWNTSGVVQYIGNNNDNGTLLQYFDGYIAEVYNIDGQQLTPSSFGSSNASTGVWQPKAYTGTYGTNGFYLKFSDIATTSGSNAGLGKDFSGNGNYWTTNNISVTSGTTYDAMTDSPTPASATVGNFAVMNPVDKTTSTTISDGNLKIAATSGWCGSRATFSLPATGKYYWEATCISRAGGATVGLLVTSATITGDIGASASGYIYNSGDGQKYNNGSASAYGATWGTNDIIGVTWDAGTGTLAFYKNGVSQGNAWTGLTSTYSPAIGVYNTDSMAVNFGQRPFAYTPPTGYVRLQTYNLPTPTIGASSTTLANKYFDVSLWTGDGSTTPRTITNSAGFQPDLVWFKNRTSAYDHCLYDSVRGGGSSKGLGSNVTYAEGGIDGAYYGYLDSFASNGFSLTAGSGPSPQRFYLINQSSNAYVGWQWRANGTGVTNTAGSITSTVSANTTSGFSVVTYTGTGSAATVGHGLGVTPAMIIVKERSTARDWPVWHKTLTGGQALFLNSTLNTQTDTAVWNNTTPTSSVFSVATSTYTNQSTGTYVAYCFAEIAGFSKFGSYTGNGSTDGTFVYTGFRPAFILVKKTDTSGTDWVVMDNKRLGYNVTDVALNPNASYAENSGYATDFTSNGFKLRTTTSFLNGSGGTYIYMAFAENPFNYSLAR